MFRLDSKVTHHLTTIYDLFLLSVCIKFLTNFASKLTDEDVKSVETIHQKLKAACGKAKNKENRFVSKINIYSIELNTSK